MMLSNLIIQKHERNKRNLLHLCSNEPEHVKKIELLRALAAETGRIINLEWTADLTFAIMIFLSIKWRFTFTCGYKTYHGLIVKTEVTVEIYFVLESDLSAFWELSGQYLALLEFLKGFCRRLSLVWCKSLGLWAEYNSDIALIIYGKAVLTKISVVDLEVQ